MGYGNRWEWNPRLREPNKQMTDLFRKLPDKFRKLTSKPTTDKFKPSTKCLITWRISPQGAASHGAQSPKKKREWRERATVHDAPSSP
jgi:hypothetical protein